MPVPDRALGRLFAVGVPLLFGLSLLTLFAAIILPPRRPAASTAAASEPVAVPPFRFTERSGAAVGNEDLRGKVWVASFVFTRCSGPCPEVTATMHRLQTELNLESEPDLRLVSFTMDPEHDTLDVLQRYAEKAERPAHPSKWLFLNGPEDEVHQLMKKGFRLAIERNPDAAAGPGVKYNHGTYLFVVDRKGRVRGHFDGYRGPTDATGERFAASYARLLATVRGVLGEKLPGEAL